MSGALDALVCSPALHGLLAVLRGGRNGVLYGVKIRLPHALVMTLLFSRGRCGGGRHPWVCSLA